MRGVLVVYGMFNPLTVMMVCSDGRFGVWVKFKTFDEVVTEKRERPGCRLSPSSM